ncbi:MAG: hypothetical protein JSV81_18815 [Anaerolineales bacterium]|nr:MAG: hypothetical protein JSV81_18815 [Anaerolineales bacterium]
MATYNILSNVELTSSRQSTEDGPARQYVWQPRPINIWIGMNPFNNLQLHVLRALRARLEARGCIFVQVPGEETELGPVAHLGIGFGAKLREEIRPSAVYGRLPKPRGTALMITAVESIPETDLFDLARGQLTRKAGQIGILVEGDLEGTQVRRALWASMAGNHSLLTGQEDQIFDDLALRVQAHAGAEKVNLYEGDDELSISWEEWSKSPVHHDIAQAGRVLGKANIIEDKVVLDQYGSDNQAREVLRFLERSALGEGMRSQFEPALRVMAVTSTGGGKINVDPDPLQGQIIPISQLTWRGYIRAIPRGCPITFNAPSIETHENGLVYLAGALVNAGVVDSFDSFMHFLKSHFAQHERIDILPSGMTTKVMAIEHFHRQPRKGTIKDPGSVELVYPDEERFPRIDFPCGVRSAELQLLSALFQARTFREPGPMDKLVIAVLPGHGSVAAYGGPRQELTNMLTHGMEMDPPVRI